MPVRFRTNVDCCQRFMDKLHEKFTGPEYPALGDKVNVFEGNTPPRIVQLKVVERTWNTEGVLTIELNLTVMWASRGHYEFEKFVESRYRVD